jgi:hypothetical protein
MMSQHSILHNLVTMQPFSSPADLQATPCIKLQYLAETGSSRTHPSARTGASTQLSSVKTQL